MARRKPDSRPVVDGEATPVSGSGPWEPYPAEEIADWDLGDEAATQGGIEKWLIRLSEAWETYRWSGLSSLDRLSIDALRLCGLTEERRAINAFCGSDSYRITAVLTGDHADRLNARLDEAIPDWAENGSFETDDQFEVRLTHEGSGAKSDLQGGDALLRSHAMAYVRGFTPLTDGRRAEGVVDILDIAAIAEDQGANSANTPKLFAGTVPKNSDIVDLVVKLDAASGSGVKWNAIAREFTGGDRKKAASLLTRIRTMRRNGTCLLKGEQ